MTHGPEHHIEHAEHAAHASHDEFNKRVTISIAMVAAVLAGVTMLGHRAHNETLLLQGEALRIQAEALQFQTLATRESANAGKQWQYYGTKNLFNFESLVMLDQLKVLQTNDNAAELAKIRKKYAGYTEKYGSKLPEEKKKGDDLEEEVNKHVKAATDKLSEYQQTMDKVHEVHEKGNRFDYGELGLQFGVVLCSLAILTKGRGFWIFGLTASVVGLVIALTGQFGLFIGHH